MKKLELINELLPLLKDEVVEVLGKQENLKCYNILFEAKEEDFEQNFEAFCELQYDLFKDFLEVQDVKLQHIGRTSTFYVVSDGIFEYYNCEEYRGIYREPKTIEEKKRMFIEDFYNIEYSMWDFPSMEDEEEVGDEEGNFEGMDDVKKYFEQYVDILEGIKKVYDYIETFKKEQVDLWNDFINDEE